MSSPDLPAVVVPERPAETAQRFRTVALAALTALLLVLCAVLVWPFLPAVAWGVALAVIAWPLQSWMSRRSSGRTLSAALGYSVSSRRARSSSSRCAGLISVA